MNKANKAKRPNLTPTFLSTPNGGSFTIERKPGETADQFSAVLQNLRSRMKVKHGVISACIVKGTTATITVLSGVDKPTAGDEHKLDRAEVRAVVRSMQPPPPSPPAPKEEPITGEEARALFKDVYLESLRIMPAASADVHSQNAQAAAREFAKRFPNA